MCDFDGLRHASQVLSKDVPGHNSSGQYSKCLPAVVRACLSKPMNWFLESYYSDFLASKNRGATACRTSMRCGTAQEIGIKYSLRVRRAEIDYGASWDQQLCEHAWPVVSSKTHHVALEMSLASRNSQVHISADRLI